MSRIRANTIVNSAGTGAPNFPRGAIISGISTINAEISVGTGTSISSPATNELALGTNDAERLRITSAGLVGINTNNPQKTLHVNSSVDNSFGIVRISGKNRGGQLEFCTDATKTAGIYSPTSSNELVFFTSSSETERLRISSGGIVTIPNQPAFHTSGNSAPLVDSTNTVIVGDTVDVNNGNCYNSSNGRFTAPIDGIYQFSFWGLIYPHASDVMNIFYSKNGTQWADLIQGGADSDSHTSRAGSVIMSMSANDYAELRINRGTGSEQAYGTQWNMCGFLIG